MRPRALRWSALSKRQVDVLCCLNHERLPLTDTGGRESEDEDCWIPRENVVVSSWLQSGLTVPCFYRTADEKPKDGPLQSTSMLFGEEEKQLGLLPTLLRAFGGMWSDQSHLLHTCGTDPGLLEVSCITRTPLCFCSHLGPTEFMGLRGALVPQVVTVEHFHRCGGFPQSQRHCTYWQHYHTGDFLVFSECFLGLLWLQKYPQGRCCQKPSLITGLEWFPLVLAHPRKRWINLTWGDLHLPAAQWTSWLPDKTNNLFPSPLPLLL